MLAFYTTDGAQFIKDYNTAYTSKQTRFYFSDSLAEASFVTGVGANSLRLSAEGTGASVPTGELNTHFVENYRKRFGDAPSKSGWVANYYDAMYMVALAMQAAGENDGARIAQQLTAVSRDGKVHSAATYAQAIADIQAGVDINYEGAAGSIDLDPSGEPIAPL